MPACHIGINADARGPNNTIVLAEASSLLAMAEGAAVIERNQADVMIVGGTGSRVHPLSWAFRDNWMHSRKYEQPGEISRPFDVTEDQLHAMFTPYGQVESARLITDRFSGQSKGFGFVEMVNDEEAQKAILELNISIFSIML